MGRQLEGGGHGGIGPVDGVDPVSGPEQEEGCGTHREQSDVPPPPAPAEDEQGDPEEPGSEPHEHARRQRIGPWPGDVHPQPDQAHQDPGDHDGQGHPPGPPSPVASQAQQGEQGEQGQCRTGHQAVVQRAADEGEAGEPAPVVHDPPPGRAQTFCRVHPGWAPDLRNCWGYLGTRLWVGHASGVGARTTSTVSSPSPAATESDWMRPASTRSARAASTSGTCAAGAVTVAASTSARIETLASDFALRTPASAAAATLTTAGSPPVGSSEAVGHSERCTDPLCHQDQTSSVTNGSTGANSRSCTESASARVAWAEAAAGPEPYARDFTSST